MLKCAADPNKISRREKMKTSGKMLLIKLAFGVVYVLSILQPFFAQIGYHIFGAVILIAIASIVSYILTNREYLKLNGNKKDDIYSTFVFRQKIQAAVGIALGMSLVGVNCYLGMEKYGETFNWFWI